LGYSQQFSQEAGSELNQQSSNTPGKTGKKKRGRKRVGETRAAEIRAKLAVWRDEPELGRRSLRALAGELGTSHQLLSFYLRGLDKWLERQCRRKADEIRARAETEDRLMTYDESRHEASYRSAASRFFASAVLSMLLRGMQKDARRGPLPPPISTMLDSIAKKGIPMAEKVLQLSRKREQDEKIKKQKRVVSLLDKLDRATGSEEALKLMRQLRPEDVEEFKALQARRARERGATKKSLQAFFEENQRKLTK
jgi:hypothetical protein